VTSAEGSYSSRNTIYELRATSALSRLIGGTVIPSATHTTIIPSATHTTIIPSATHTTIIPSEAKHLALAKNNRIMGA